MGFKNFFNNAITFGAYGRVQDAIEAYNSTARDLKNLNTEMESRKTAVNLILLDVVEIKKNALNSLNKIREITKNIKEKDREFTTKQISQEKIDLCYIENVLDVANSVLSASKGIGAGIATSSAVYLLIGQLGTASTGTAISTLSGVAATNATLAWLGGGSLAAGGGGILAGTVMLGGLVAIPALTFMGIFNHLSANKKIKEIKEKEYEAEKMIDSIKKNILILELIETKSNEITEAIKKTNNVFDVEFKRVLERIYPIPFLSKLIKSIKKILGLNYFSKKDLNEISYILNIATKFARLIDTKVLEDK